MNDFINKIHKKLEKLSEKEKDSWIISQAKLTPEWRQDDCYKSICGIKKVMYTPEQQEIDEFCVKVQRGEIVVEYETHYVEFDDFGHYHDDWEQIYHDPNDAMSTVSAIIRRCHDLVILEEYSQAYEILDNLIGLEFTIVDHPDSDDTCKDDFLDLNHAVKAGILSIDRSELLHDYIKTCGKSITDRNEAARKIASAVEMELFAGCNLNDSILMLEKDHLMGQLKKILVEDLAAKEKVLSEMLKQDKYYSGQYRDVYCIRQLKGLIDYFEKTGTKDNKQDKSFLRGTWSQINELLGQLMNEPYIDDQVEIEEIWKIVEALIKRGGFEREPWQVKEQILKEIYENEFYDYYGVSDPMLDLSNAICSTRDENLKRAEIMMHTGGEWLGAKAAKLYRELGEEVKCAEYFEKHLGKEKEAYEIVINYYKNFAHDKAVEIARLALDKCKEEQTSFFMFLLQDAKDKGDDTGFQKLMQSAHRRRTVNSSEVDLHFIK